MTVFGEVACLPMSYMRSMKSTNQKQALCSTRLFNRWNVLDYLILRKNFLEKISVDKYSLNRNRATNRIFSSTNLIGESKRERQNNKEKKRNISYRSFLLHSYYVVFLLNFSFEFYVKSIVVEMSHRESRDRRTLYCGNLHEYVTEELLFELFLQVRIQIYVFLKNELKKKCT